MKKVLIALFLILMGFQLISCQSNDTTTTVRRATPFEQFQEKLDDKDLSYKKVTMAAELLGARQGIKYKTDKGDVELYVFEDDSEVYEEAYETQSLRLEGFGAIPVIARDNMVLLIHDDADERFFKRIFNTITN